VKKLRRITYVGERTFSFWYKDKKLRRKVYVQCSPEEFIERWSQHIPERYRHAVRNFGLFAPRAVRHFFDAVFAVLGQERSLRPKPRPWAESINRDFGRDPLLDSKGMRMRWVGKAEHFLCLAAHPSLIDQPAPDSARISLTVSHERQRLLWASSRSPLEKISLSQTWVHVT
jgi:Putative transposase